MFSALARLSHRYSARESRDEDLQSGFMLHHVAFQHLQVEFLVIWTSSDSALVGFRLSIVAMSPNCVYRSKRTTLPGCLCARTHRQTRGDGALSYAALPPLQPAPWATARRIGRHANSGVNRPLADVVRLSIASQGDPTTTIGDGRYALSPDRIAFRRICVSGWPSPIRRCVSLRRRKTDHLRRFKAVQYGQIGFMRAISGAASPQAARPPARPPPYRRSRTYHSQVQLTELIPDSSLLGRDQYSHFAVFGRHCRTNSYSNSIPALGWASTTPRSTI
jgi:hypothetical protein